MSLLTRIVDLFQWCHGFDQPICTFEHHRRYTAADGIYVLLLEFVREIGRADHSLKDEPQDSWKLLAVPIR